ncbi:hypothetical protein BB561_007032, partial [Smittium simulii]
SEHNTKSDKLDNTKPRYNIETDHTIDNTKSEKINNTKNHNTKPGYFNNRGKIVNAKNHKNKPVYNNMSDKLDNTKNSNTKPDHTRDNTDFKNSKDIVDPGLTTEQVKEPQDQSCINTQLTTNPTEY